MVPVHRPYDHSVQIVLAGVLGVLQLSSQFVPIFVYLRIFCYHRHSQNIRISSLLFNMSQGNASESAKWGQKLNTDDYPLLNSADKVYSDSPITMKCSGELEGTGTFTNTMPAQEGTFKMQHGNSIIHHESVDVTCTVDGTIEYWECDACNETYFDEKLTQPVGNIIKEAATGHNYDENDKCTKCQKEIQFVKLGNNNITIEKVFG